MRKDISMSDENINYINKLIDNLGEKVGDVHAQIPGIHTEVLYTNGGSSGHSPSFTPNINSHAAFGNSTSGGGDNNKGGAITRVRNALTTKNISYWLQLDYVQLSLIFAGIIIFFVFTKPKIILKDIKSTDTKLATKSGSITVTQSKQVINIKRVVVLTGVIACMLFFGYRYRHLLYQRNDLN